MKPGTHEPFTYRGITIHKLGQQPLQPFLLGQRFILLGHQPHNLEPLFPLLRGPNEPLGAAVMDRPYNCCQGLGKGLSAGSGPAVGITALVSITAATDLGLGTYCVVDLHAGTNDAELRARSWGRMSLTHFLVREL